MAWMSFRWVALGMVALVAACAQPPVPQDRYYRIDVSAAASGAPILIGVLEVERLAAEGLASGRAVVYSEADNPQLAQEYFYDFWIEPPSDMLRDELVDFLRASGAATAIVTPETRADADYVLTGRINRLEHVRGPKAKGVIDLELAVTHARTGKLVMVNSYAVGVGASDGSVASGIAALNQGVAAIFERFLADLKASG
ncbi:MAG: ABC-type transport auxiliary lipoprotein family protein [Rhodospirillales bacterium]